MPQVQNAVSLGMLDVHRVAIQRNHQYLVENCNIESLLPKLLEKRVFSSEMVKRFQTDNEKENREKLFKGIVKRGPHAFESLLTALQETGQKNIVDTLKSNIVLINNTFDDQPRHRSHAHPFQLPINEEGITHNTERIKQLGSIFCNINIQTEPLKVNVEKASHFYDNVNKIPTYRTRSKTRGAVLILNNKVFINDIEPVRKGSEVDVANLQELFKQMNMYVETHINASKEETVRIIKSFSNNPVLISADMLFVCLMSHGNKGDHDTNVIFSDGNMMDTHDIEEEFNNSRCLHMQKKPKIFIYQICRGKENDFGAMKRTATDSSLQNATIRTRDDMLIAHSTLPDKESHRDVFLGSWFIQLICEVFMRHACDTHVEAMLKMVDNKLENLRSENQTMQTSVYTNQGFKNCFIHPGIYEENGETKYF